MPRTRLPAWAFLPAWARWPAWATWRELSDYLAGSQASHLQKIRSLRALDDHLLADIGLRRSGFRPVLLANCEPFSESSPMTNASFTPPAMTHAPDGALIVRDALPADMAAIRAIYAHHVLHGLASFEEAVPSLDEMLARRGSVLAQGLPYLAAEQDGAIVGYCYAGSYRPRPAYRHTIEDSVYVADGNAGRGIGRALLSALIARCEAGTWRQMLAVIGDSGNAGSIGLHRALGFETVGTLRAVGFKFGRWVDSVLMQRALGTGDGTPPDTYPAPRG